MVISAILSKLSQRSQPCPLLTLTGGDKLAHCVLTACSMLGPRRRTNMTELSAQLHVYGRREHSWISALNSYKLRYVRLPKHTDQCLNQEAYNKYNSLFEIRILHSRLHRQVRAGMCEKQRKVRRKQMLIRNISTNCTKTCAVLSVDTGGTYTGGTYTGCTYTGVTYTDGTYTRGTYTGGTYTKH
jgi:hypothetical protein